jgi:voltage-gated potassium channel
MRKKLHFYLTDIKNKYAIAIDVIIYSIIFIDIIDHALMTVDSMQQYAHYFNAWDNVPLTIFSIEYILRVYSNPKRLKFIFSFWGIIDLLAIIGLSGAGPYILREIRALRFISLFKYEPAAMNILTAFREIKKELMYFTLMAMFMLYVSAVGVYYFENPTNSENFPDIFQSLWWAVVTLTTVGYGDISPVTHGGQIFAGIIIMIGLGIFAVPTGLIAGAFSDIFKKNKGK